MTPLQFIRRVLTVADSQPVPQKRIGDGAYSNFVAQIGTQRDKASHGKFAQALRLSETELENLYKLDPIARKVIERPAADMLRASWYYTGASDRQIRQLQAEIKRLNVMGHLLNLLAKSRLYGTAYLLLGVAGNEPLELPLSPDRIQPGGLAFLTTLKPMQLVANNIYLQAHDSMGRLKMPEFYQLQQETGGQVTVHHSRVIRLDAPSIVDNQDGLGWSVLQTLYDCLLRYASVNASAASLVHESKIDIIKTPDLMNRLLNGMTSIIERYTSVGLLKGINGMIVLDKDEEYDSKTYTFGGLPELMQEFSVQTAGAADIPYTILFGQSPAGMNATGEHDTRNYYDSIATQQNGQLRPILERLLPMVSRSALGNPLAGLEVVFNPLWQLDAKTRSEIEMANSQRDTAYLQAGIVTEAQIAQQLMDDGTYTVIDNAHIALLSEMVNQVSDADATDPAA